jgi:hypothetical protein
MSLKRKAKVVLRRLALAMVVGGLFMCKALFWGKMVPWGIVLSKLWFTKYYGTHHVFVSKGCKNTNVLAVMWFLGRL